MSETFGDVELLLVFGRKRNTFPFTKRRAPLAEVYRHVKDFAIDNAHEFALRVLLLEMEATEHALLAAGLVILHKDHVEAGGVKLRLVIRFHKIATVVTENRRFHDSHAFDRCLDKIELTHSST